MQASYLVAVALAVLVGVLLPPMLCYRGLLAWRASRPRDPELDAYELAWLAAGWRRAVDVAAVGLVAKDVLRRSRSRTYTRVAGTSLSGAHPLEESLAGFAGARPGGSSQRELEQAPELRPVRRAIRRRLVRLGLVHPWVVQGVQAVVPMLFLPVLFLGGYAALEFVTLLWEDGPLPARTGEILLLALASFAGLVVLAPREADRGDLSRAGRAVLRRARSRWPADGAMLEAYALHGEYAGEWREAAGIPQPTPHVERTAPPDRPARSRRDDGDGGGAGGCGDDGCGCGGE
ncbi:TIGR04222 domain-containing membrane protein [Thermocatellispora tengchongensis]|nr:TIGR04222 domain-containing membrane protein [Thermocatellispora tengchongensis]